ncbi:MAG: hypothetical protein V1747_00070, partial [Candidatus Omnitrophota bacterium]
ALLDKYQPDIVLVMIGTNDEWNYSGFLSAHNPVIDRMYLFVSSLRISRMFRILTKAFRKNQDLNCFEVLEDKKQINKMLSLIEKNGGLNNSYYYQTVMLGNEYRDKNKFEEAKLYYDCALRINPDDVLIANELLRYYKRALTVSMDELKIDLFEKNKSELENYIRSVYLYKEYSEPDNKFMLEMIDLSKICRTLSLFEDNLLLLTKTIYLYGFSKEIWEEFDELFIAWSYPENAIEFYINLSIKYPDNIDIYLRLANQYKRVQDYKQVVKYLKKVLELIPNNQQAIDGIVMANEFIDQDLTKDYVLLSKNEKLFAEINTVLEGGKTKFQSDDPANNLVEQPSVALSIYVQEKRYDQQVEKILCQDKTYAKLFANGALDPDVFVEKRLAKINNIVSQRIKQMCDLAKQRKIKMFVLSYPLTVYETVQDTALSENISFIDFRPSFSAIITPANFKDYFLADGHCTEKGYKIVADKIAQVVFQ